MKQQCFGANSCFDFYSNVLVVIPALISRKTDYLNAVGMVPSDIQVHFYPPLIYVQQNSQAEFLIFLHLGGLVEPKSKRSSTRNSLNSHFCYFQLNCFASNHQVQIQTFPTNLFVTLDELQCSVVSLLQLDFHNLEGCCYFYDWVRKHLHFQSEGHRYLELEKLGF